VVLLCLIGGIFLWQKISEPTQSPAQPTKELKLSDFPEAFKEKTVIVLGDNASEIERQVAEEIKNFLLEHNSSYIKIINSQKIGSFKKGYDLVIIGTPKTNPLLEEVYALTNATKVTEEFPGEGKGVLEILPNPWDESKAMLLVEGWDEQIVRTGSEILLQKNKFNFLPNSYGSENPINIAKIALKKRCGENWTNKYLILGITVKHPLLSFNHTFVRVDPCNFSILITSESIYFLSPNDFNHFLNIYGNRVNESWSGRDFANLFEILKYLLLAYCIHQGLPENIYFLRDKRRIKWYTLAIIWYLLSLMWIFISPLHWILPKFIGYPATTEIFWIITKILFFPTFLCYYTMYSFFVCIAGSDPHEAVWVFWPSLFIALPWYLIVTYVAFKVKEVVLKWERKHA